MASSKRYGKKAAEKVERAMHEMKRGKLKSGRSNRKVTNPKQAVAIGLSEARKAGGKVPAEPKKKAAKKTATKKTATKKTATKKTAAKKTTSKKTAPKKAAAKKSTTSKKTATKKTASKKTAAKKTSPKKTTAKKTSSKKTTQKRPTETKAARGTTEKASPPKKLTEARSDSAIERTRPRREAPNGQTERTSRARDGVEETDDEGVNTLATGDDEDDGFEARFEADGDGDGNGPPTDQANEDMVNGTAPHEQRALQRAAALQAVNQRLMRDPPTKPLFKHHRVGLHRTPHRG